MGHIQTQNAASLYDKLVSELSGSVH